MSYFVKLAERYQGETRKIGGLEFDKDGRELSDDEMTDAVKNDPWLNVRTLMAATAEISEPEKSENIYDEED